MMNAFLSVAENEAEVILNITLRQLDYFGGFA